MTAQFSPILDKQSSAIERPKPFPTGLYLWAIKGLPRYDESTKKKTPFAEFTCVALEAKQDVDEEALEVFGGLTAKDMKVTFYLTDDAAWRLVKFLDDAQAGDQEMSIRERCEEANGCQFLGEIIHEASQDGQNVFARIGQTFPNK